MHPFVLLQPKNMVGNFDVFFLLFCTTKEQNRLKRIDHTLTILKPFYHILQVTLSNLLEFAVMQASGLN